MKFNDTMMVHVKHDTDFEIPLRCFGIGNTITTDINLSNIKFGDQYTSAEVLTEFFITNKSRKAVKFTWQRVLDVEQIDRYFKSMKSVEIDKIKLRVNGSKWRIRSSLSKSILRHSHSSLGPVSNSLCKLSLSKKGCCRNVSSARHKLKIIVTTKWPRKLKWKLTSLIR